jgi:hypothetical protein
MGFFDQLIDAHTYQIQNFAKNLDQNPERALLGINTPLETKAWNGVLGTNYQPNMGMLGQPVAQQYSGPQAPIGLMGGLTAPAAMRMAQPGQTQYNPQAQGGLGGYKAQGFAKGGLTAANENIKQIQMMKVFAHYFKNLGVPVEIGMKGLQKEIDNGLQLIPFESSVMGFKPLDGTTAQIHFFTVGTVKSLADDMRYFYKYLKDKGITTIYDTLPAPITSSVLIKLGAKEEKSDNPKYKFKATI